MKLDNIISPAAPTVVIEAKQQSRYGKYQLLGSWGASGSIQNCKTTLGGAPVDQPSVYNNGPRPPSFFAAMDSDWGEKDDGSGLRRGAVPVSIRLAINPELAQEGDE